jgi:hypothetical protein
MLQELHHGGHGSSNEDTEEHGGWHVASQAAATAAVCAGWIAKFTSDNNDRNSLVISRSRLHTIGRPCRPICDANSFVSFVPSMLRCDVKYSFKIV